MNAMNSTKRLALLLSAVATGAAACAVGAPQPPVPQPPAPQAALRPPSADRGHSVYRRACGACHGARGDGRGPGATGLVPEPRDFTRATYAYRSTPTGSLPQDTDLVRTVTLGLPDTSMPAWRDHLSAQEIVDVVAYVKGFSPRFAEEEIDPSIEIPEPVPYSAESVALGKKAYEKVQCGKCHGEKGKGDGWAKDDEQRDALGRVMKARDFTRGVYRSGRTRQDLFRVFYTGLDGTPMPGYEKSLPPEDIYHLVNYLLSLERERGVLYWLSTPPRWYEPDDQAISR